MTDLDESLGERALRSLEAELARREERLREAGAADLDQLRRTAPGQPLPRLAVIVDEFALLARELPGFMETLVDIAQRGRSLGVHLALATQQPAGVVKDSIRANVNLRICLRVQTTADSKDVLGAGPGAGLAAGLPPTLPGRGFIRRGPEEPIPFQTALVSGCGETGPQIRVSPFLFGMIQPVPPASPDPEPARREETDLTRLAAAASRVWEGMGRPAPRRPWAPPLRPDLAFGETSLPDPPPDGAPQATLGAADQPDRQRQVPWSWLPASHGNLLLMGQAGSGTQDGLLGAACSLASARGPDRLRIYGLDSGRGRLAELEHLPHTGSVVPLSDAERLERLLAMLRDRVGQSPPPPSQPWLILLVDDLGELRTALAETGLEDLFGEICRGGPARRVATAAAADQARAVPPSPVVGFRGQAGFFPGRPFGLVHAGDAARYGRSAPAAGGGPPHRGLRAGGGGGGGRCKTNRATGGGRPSGPSHPRFAPPGFPASNGAGRLHDRPGVGFAPRHGRGFSAADGHHLARGRSSAHRRPEPLRTFHRPADGGLRGAHPLSADGAGGRLPPPLPVGRPPRLGGGVPPLGGCGNPCSTTGRTANVSSFS